MYRPLLITTLPLLFLSAQASAFEIGGGSCNNRSYQGDTDAPVDVNLYSTAVQHIWTCEVTDAVSNLSGNKQFEVDYQAAELYVGNLGPLRSKIVRRSSWKSCTIVPGAATFTRLTPTAGKTRSVATAPACGFGFRTFRQLKDILGTFNSAKKLVTTVEDTDINAGTSREVLVASTSFDRDSDAGVWEYTLQIDNPSEDYVSIYIDGPWGYLTDEPIDTSVAPGASVEWTLRVPVGDAGDEPEEYTAELEYDNGGDDFGALRIAMVAPTDLGLHLVGDVDGDGTLSVSDGIALNQYLYSGGTAPSCMDATDFNEDGRTDLSDTMALFNFLFQGGPAPRTSHIDCGQRRSDVTLTQTSIAPADDTYTPTWSD